MTVNRRMGPKNSETRSELLDHAERMMFEQGYAAVTSRKLASVAGLSPQIVYYYFKTMDELFEALFDRQSEMLLARIDEAAEAENPVMALWELSSDPSRAAVISEFVALANHRKGMSAKVREFGREFHRRQTMIIAGELDRNEIDQNRWPPAVIAAILENAARGFAFSSGLSIGAHEDAREYITARIQEFFSG